MTATYQNVVSKLISKLCAVHIKGFLLFLLKVK